MKFEVLDGRGLPGHLRDGAIEIRPAAGTPSLRFRAFKKSVDLGLAALALPMIGTTALVLVCVNPVLNPGPVFFRQSRMGLHGEPFLVWKFRTMTPCSVGLRAHDAPFDSHRVTPLGAVMRRYRIDELPNFLNVLRGEMSVVGPRPDAFEHAVVYQEKVPHYRERFRVKPGITGIAQVRLGYAETTDIVKRKARYDQLYVRKARSRTDLYILGQTLRVVLNGFGAK
jgi:lipopolysaccharide/colanic/teichoic acid biosynthesis glycosyltransferase